MLGYYKNVSKEIGPPPYSSSCLHHIDMLLPHIQPCFPSCVHVYVNPNEGIDTLDYKKTKFNKEDTWLVCCDQMPCLLCWCDTQRKVWNMYIYIPQQWHEGFLQVNLQVTNQMSISGWKKLYKQGGILLNILKRVLSYHVQIFIKYLNFRCWKMWHSALFVKIGSSINGSNPQRSDITIVLMRWTLLWNKSLSLLYWYLA